MVFRPDSTDQVEVAADRGAASHLREVGVQQGPRGAGADGRALRTERGIREMERDVFRVRVSTGRRDSLTGSPKQLERIVRGGVREARRVHSELESEVKKGRLGDPTMTLGELLDLWLALCEKRLGKPGRGGLAKNTFDNYKLQVRTLKETHLASVQLSRLTTRKPIEEAYEAFSEVLGPARIVQLHKVLRAAFNHAVGEGWMIVNPAALIRDKPAPPKSKRTIPTREQVEAAFAEARSRHPDLDTFLATAALTGLRRQALCGLKWSDIDFHEKAISLRRVVNMVGGRPVVSEHAKHRRGRALPPPKYLDQALVPVLTELHERQAQRARESGTTLPKDGWLFSRDGMGRDHVSPSHFGRLVSDVMDTIGIDATLHSLRHHRGSKLVSEGVDPAVAARELDHQSLSYFLDTYVHPVRSSIDPKLERIGRAYGIGGSDRVPSSQERGVSRDAPKG